MNNFENLAISSFGKDYIRTSKQTELVFTCPKCNRQKLYVNTTNGVFHCFRCDFSGKLKSSPKLKDVVTTLKDNKRNLINNTVNSNDIILVPFHRTPLSQEQRKALYNRGITDADIEYYNISGGKRIQIPNFIMGNLSDVICKWEYNKSKITKTNPKYLYNEGTKKSLVLFNLHNIKQNTDNITICEGLFNAITAGKNAVATYGCSPSDRQIDLLLTKNPKTITIAYDPDLPGVNGAIKLIQKLKQRNYKGKVYYILLPKNKDINDLGKQKYKIYLKNNIKRIYIDNNLSCNLPFILYNNMI